MIDKEIEYQKMAEVEENLWWYRILHQQVAKVLQKHHVNPTANILDAGCGTGGLMEYLAKKGYQQLQGLDLSENAIKYCKAKNLNVIQDNVQNVTNHFEKESFDVIISNDVLCYFEEKEQNELMDKLMSLLKKDGLLIVNLPALKAFGGIHDISVGLIYRFSKNRVKQIKGAENYKILSQRYWPFFLSPIIYTIRLKQRREMRTNQNFEVKSDVSIPSTLVNGLLYLVTSIEIKLPNFTPFGSSLFAVFQKVDKSNAQE